MNFKSVVDDDFQSNFLNSDLGLPFHGFDALDRQTNGYLELPGILVPSSSSSLSIPVQDARVSPDSCSENGWNSEGAGSSPSGDSDVSSDLTIKYIGEMLLEEDIDDKPYMYDNLAALRETESSFYDAIGQQYPPEEISNLDGGKLSNLKSFVSGEMSDSYACQMVRNMFSDDQSVLLFRKGLEEASKFLPSPEQFAVDLGSYQVVKEDEKSRKTHERDEDHAEGRSTKQSATFVEDDACSDSALSEMFDKVLLLPNPDSCEGSNSGKSVQTSPKIKAKRQGKKKQAVDLRTQLILCAQAVSASDFRTAGELLKQIRYHSSKNGDGTQRLAHYFANGLEARLAGSTSGVQNFYSAISVKKTSAAELLKAFQTLICCCPIKRFSMSYMNSKIISACDDAKTLHIVDFGILYGYQWPSLIQLLSSRQGRTPPKLRITGIELPQRGFRPTARIEETGRRLANYCQRFNIEFEYNCIAEKNWEKIKIEDLKINKGETLAVNCLYRLKNFLDETGERDCPRDAFLSLIRKMNPDIFCFSESNGAYNSPFFVTRFREALFHFSAVFDILDSTLPQDHPEREMVEAELCGREAINAVACEGAERVERPETYKQWQIRTARAGFREVALDEDVVETFRCKLRAHYHKDLVIDEDGHWLLHGWKGRIISSTSCWVPY